MLPISQFDIETRPLVLVIQLRKQNVLLAKIAAGLCILWSGTSHANVYHFA